jgi:hypothetical protein
MRGCVLPTGGPAAEVRHAPSGLARAVRPAGLVEAPGQQRAAGASRADENRTRWRHFLLPVSVRRMPSSAGQAGHGSAPRQGRFLSRPAGGNAKRGERASHSVPFTLASLNVNKLILNAPVALALAACASTTAPGA